MTTRGGYVPSPATVPGSSGGPPLHPCWSWTRAAAAARRHPILDREAGRILSALAGRRRQIVEVGTAYGYSTLCMALGQPAGRDHLTIRPGSLGEPRIARGWWRRAG